MSPQWAPSPSCMRPFRFCVALLHLYWAFHYHMVLFPVRQPPPPLGRGMIGGGLCRLCLQMHESLTINHSSVFYMTDTMGTFHYRPAERKIKTRSSSADEIANVNFLQRYRTRTTKYNRLAHKFRHRPTFDQ